ncbi:hypothetical protein DQ384_09645 [Sphaerisporangium album]|uniref:Uncharacterized protein n=1 Tax=Sphaerisporangium album TaxID=509200 RepID=A0A367FQA0_9ACTN|nr:hypothetical protein [Sphaerisporangium album]RCG31785.1 hypothetical protein DQ384_09645 [Sphaerisporangium album]
MSKLIARVAGPFLVMYGSFTVMDLDGLSFSSVALAPEELYELVRQGDPWFAVTENMAIVCSRQGYHHIADVALELWDGEPPADPEGQAGTAAEPMRSSSGRVRAGNSMGNGGPVLDLGEPAALWSVRAQRIKKASQAVVYFSSDEAYDDEDDDDSGYPEGLEEFRIQFWPAARPLGY